MHDEISAFCLDGQINDSNLVETKEMLVKVLEDSMRDTGFVPSLDLDPHFTLDYLPSEEAYNFKLTIYGIYVGEKRSWTIAGITNGKTVMRYTPRDKSRV